MSVNDPERAKKKARQAQKFADYSIKKTLNKEEVELEENDKVMMMKLTTKAMKAIPNSPKQKELIKQVNTYREKLGMKPMNEKYDEMTNAEQSTLTPIELLKKLKDKIDAKDPAQMEGQSFTDFEKERIDQMSRTANERSVLMYRIVDLDHGDAGEIENFTYVMKENIPKYQQMGYKVVAQ